MKFFRKNLLEVVNNSQHFPLADRKPKLQLDNPSELKPPNKGQTKRIILGIYSRFFQAYFFIYEYFP